MREDWATSWAKLMSPGGVLLTLIFPVDPERDPNKVAGVPSVLYVLQVYRMCCA